MCNHILIRSCPVLGPALSVWSTSNVGTLHSALTSGYQTQIRPSEATNVSLDFGISSLSDLTWTDPRLQWTASSFNDISNTFMLSSQIWVPPLILNNAAEGVEVLTDVSELASLPINVFNTGSCVWLVPGEYAASCDIDIFKYPFDTQTCNLMISSWMFSITELNLLASTTSVGMDVYQSNGEWDLTSSEVSETTQTIHNHPLATVQFDLTFKRLTGYYIINMLLPVVLLTVLGAVVFLLPVESGEKNGFSLTILLSLSVVMSIVAGDIPTTSTHTSILSVYLLAAFWLCTIEVVLTVLTVRWHTCDADGYTLPAWLQQLMKNKMVPLARYMRADEVHVPAMAPKSKVNGKVDPGVIDVECDTERIHTPAAWDKKGMNGAHVKDYGYKDFAIVLDSLNFYLFSILTFLVNIIFLIILVA